MPLTDRPPLAPYRRLTTQTVHKEAAYEPRFVVDGNRFYSIALDTCVAFDLAAGKPLWTVKMPGRERAEGLAASDGTVFVTTESSLRESSYRMVAIDGPSGRVTWTL